MASALGLVDPGDGGLAGLHKADWIKRLTRLPTYRPNLFEPRVFVSEGAVL